MSDRPLRAASLERSLAIIRDLPGVTVKDATLRSLRGRSSQK